METEAPPPQVHLVEIVTRLTPGRAWFCAETGISPARWGHLKAGFAWRRDEIEAGLAAIHRLADTLRALGWADVVDAGAEVLPAGIPQRRPRGPRRKK